MAQSTTTPDLMAQLKGSLGKKGKKVKPVAKTKAPVKPVVTRRAARYAESDIIKVTDKGKVNPKRGQTTAWKLYEIYLKNKNLTVGKYIELAGATDRPKAGRTAINWDVARKYITVSSK